MKKLLRFCLILFCLVATLEAKQMYDVSYDPDYAPYTFKEDGKAKGLFIDIWKAWAKANNYEIKFIDGKGWDKAINLAKYGAVDFFSGSDPYEKWMLGSLPFYVTETGFYQLKNNKKTDKIGIIGEDFKESIIEHFPKAKVVSYEEYGELLDALVKKDVDLIYDDRLALSIIVGKSSSKDLIEQGAYFNEKTPTSAISVKKELIKIFNDGFKKVNKKDLMQMEEKWVKNESDRHFKDTSKLILTANEKKYLKKYKEVKVCFDPKWAPFEFIEYGEVKGVDVDIINKVGKILNKKIQFVKSDSFKQAIEFFKDKKCDMLLAASKTKERAKYAIFTKPYIYSAVSMITRDNIDKNLTIEDVSKLKVIIPASFSLNQTLKETYPNIDIINSKDIQDAFIMLSKGKGDVVFETKPVFYYYKVKNNLNNIKLSGVSKEIYDLSFVFLKNNSLLLSAFQKALDTIPSKDIEKMQEEWRNEDKINTFDVNLIYRIISIIVVLIIILFIFLKFKKMDYKKILNSIIFKTSISIVISLTIITGAIIWYIAVKQNQIMEDIQKEQEQYIITQLDRVEKDKLNREIALLHTMSSLVRGPIASSLFNDDEDGAKETMDKFLKNDIISGISIYDEAGEEFFMNAYIKKREDGKTDIIYDDYLPADITKLKFLEFNLSSYESTIGKFKIYYDLSDIKESIKKTKEMDIEDFEENAKIMKIRSQKNLQSQVFFMALGGLILLIIIIIMLLKLVNEPLREFKRGLTSFFDYLGDNEKKIIPIDIDTNDEFGQMGKEVNKNITVSMRIHSEISRLIKLMDKNIISTETNAKGYIVSASKALSELSGYSIDELIGMLHKEMFHPDMDSDTILEIRNTIHSGEIWRGEILDKKKDGTPFWLQTIITPKCQQIKDGEKATCEFNTISYDITDKKAVEDLTANLEIKIQARTKELESEKKNVEQILANILLPVLITSKAKRTIVYANKYAQELYDASEEMIIGAGVDDIYTLTNGPEELIRQIIETGRVLGLEEEITTHSGKEFVGLLSIVPITYNDEDCYIGMAVDITRQKEMENEVRAIHKHTRESIEYASLIQGALLPEEKLMGNYFKDFFVHWMPKDTVGGDIWLFNDLRYEEECLLFFIDCTGHGVPGAFVTMIVKAVEREVVAKIKKDKNIDISPAWIMAYFNKTMKTLLKQETKDSKSNAGWDGGVIYYNRATQILKFAGAETPLFYTDEQGELKTIKGNRYSVGYKKCAMDYTYKETILEVKEGMKFYCTTDGYLDQNGGQKDFPFGKKQFGNIIKDNHTKPMIEQKQKFLDAMDSWEGAIENNDRNDDMTVIAFEIQETYIKPITILEYDGVLTQGIIAHSMDVLEHSIEDMSMMGKVSTLVVELTQNMMKYSKSADLNCTDIRPAGFIEVTKDKDGIYSTVSKNIISFDDKQKIENTLQEIDELDEAGIKKKYKELRRSGANTHEKGGGIGFYEIAKLISSMEYNFENINDEKCEFLFRCVVKGKRKRD